MQLRAIQRIAGGVVGLASVVALPPLAFALVDRDGSAFAFLASFALTGGFGLLLWLTAGPVKADLRLREGFLVTTLSWTSVCAASALPFMLAPPYLGLADALFEATSGITTTGATVITQIDGLPRSVLFYRQLLHFIGGMGIVILAVAILPMLRVGGLQLFRAEISGAVRDTKLTPRITETAKLLWLIYVGLTALCAVFYWLAGMTAFDAVGHAFSTVATAGFSTHDAGIAHYDSPLVETVAMLFMLLGATNFSVHYLAWHRATTAPYRGDRELALLLRVVLVAALGCTAALYLHGVYPSIATAFRHASFAVVAAITTTGFTSQAFALWPGALPLLIVLLSFSGGCAGSTTGGLKVRRLAVMLKVGVRELRQLIHPHATLVLRAAGRPIDNDAMRAVAGFVALYLASLILFTIALASTGLDLVTAASAAAACINNLGPALGGAAMHYGGLSDTPVAILTLAMIVGRLEVFTLLVLLTPAFWRE